MAWGQRRTATRQQSGTRLVAARHGSQVRPGPLWLRDVEAHPDTAALRADSLATLRAVAWALASRARSDGSTAPTWDALAAQTGRSRRTVARWLAWLRERRLLVVVRTGAVARTPDEPNECAIYALTRQVRAEVRPPGDEHGTPPCAPSGSTQDARAKHAATATAAPSGWPLTRRTTSRQERLAAAERLRAQVVALRPVGTRALRSVLRPWLAAGWTVADLLHALDRRPDGTAWTYEAAPRVPLAWLRWRLAAWTGHRPPSEARAEHRAAALAAQLEHRAAAKEAEAAATRCPAALAAEMRRAVDAARWAARAVPA